MDKVGCIRSGGEGGDNLGDGDGLVARQLLLLLRRLRRVILGDGDGSVTCSKCITNLETQASSGSQ